MCKYVVITLAFALVSIQLCGASDYTWTGKANDNNWKTPGNWEVGTGSQATNPPGFNDSVEIGESYTVSTPLEWVVVSSLILRGTLNIGVGSYFRVRYGAEVGGTINSQGSKFRQSSIHFFSTITLTGDSVFNLYGASRFDDAITGAYNLQLNYGTNKPQLPIPITVSNLMITTTSTTTWYCPSVSAHSLLLNTDGSVIQSTGTSIRDAAGGDSCRLQVEGMGSFVLDSAENRVNTIAISIDSDFSYRGGGILTVRELDLANTGTPITGITTGGNLTFSGTSVNAQKGMQIGGNLNIDDGSLDAGSQTIEIVGNMTVTTPGVFKAGTGTVRFIRLDSILEANKSTFNNLEVIDSNLEVRNNDFMVIGRVRIASSSETNPAQLEFFRGNHTATIANLLLEGSDPTVDFANWNFDINTSLDNEDGKIRLTGEQATQTFAYDDADASKMGLVSYYNGLGVGTIRHGDFWDFEIDATGQTINLGLDINIHGFHNPNSNKTLSVPVSEADLIGFQLHNGTLNTAGHTISLHGSYVRADSTMITGDLKLTLLGDYPAYIGGNNDFSEFICEDISVRGKILYFQSGKTTSVTTRFTIRGSGDHRPGNPLNTNSPVFPFPRSYVYVVSSQPSNATHYWDFNRNSSAELILKFVYLLHSDASANPQTSPTDVSFQDCPGWHTPPYIMLSWTKDIGDIDEPAVQNGRIDKILILVGRSSDFGKDPTLNMDFSELVVEVEGYRVKGYRAHGSESDKFYIELEEQAYLDTSSTPKWKFIKNDSLKDDNGFEVLLYDGGEDSSKAKAFEIPYDDAAPIIGYTLAIADKNEIFVHFSEPVVRSDSSSIAVGDFITTAGGGVASLRRVSDETNNGMQELILTSRNNISAEDIFNGVTVNADANARLSDISSPRSTHEFDTDSRDPADTMTTLVNDAHRVSDVGLGVVGNGLVEPVSARSSITPVSGSGLGVVSKFAWNDFLPANDFSIIAHRYTGITEAPSLIYSNSATAEVKNGKLWLPTFGENARLEHNFSGLVPAPHTQTVTKNALSSNNDNYTYQFRTPPDTMIENGKDMEFVFYFANSNLYCAQVLDDTASNWYRKVAPWAIGIRNIAIQAGNVSILNNILNPDNNDKTSMYYELRTRGVVTIQVFDLSGNTVAVLQRGFQDAGKYTVSWDGRNDAGNSVARGIYLVRLVGPDKMDQMRKVLVIK